MKGVRLGLGLVVGWMVGGRAARWVIELEMAWAVLSDQMLVKGLVVELEMEWVLLLELGLALELVVEMDKELQ